MANNYNKTLNVNYKIQQVAINKVCEDLGLVVYRPNYHGDKTDKNTVLVYTNEAHEYNKTLPEWANYEQQKPYICHFENTDRNGHFDFGFMNHGKLDLRAYNKEEEVIKEFIISKM